MNYLQSNQIKWLMTLLLISALASCSGIVNKSSLSQSDNQDENWIKSLETSYDMEPATLTDDLGNPFRIPAGRRISTTVKFPLDKDENIDSTSVKDFSVSSKKHVHSSDDAVFPYLNDKNYSVESCPVEFVALRGSFPLKGEKDLFSEKETISTASVICTEMIAIPTMPEHRCGKMTEKNLIGKVLRICVEQQFEYSTLESHQRTFMLGPFHCPDNKKCAASYTGDWVSQKNAEAFKEDKEAYVAEFSKSMAHLSESFRKSEIAYDKFYKTLPITKEGLALAARHVAFASVATATVNLSYWTQFLSQAVLSAVASAAEELMTQKSLDKKAAKHTFDQVSQKAARDAVNRSLTTAYVGMLSKNAAKKPSGAVQAAKVPTATSDIFSGITFVVVGLVIDYYNGNLDEGVYAKDSSVPEDVMERIASAAMAILSYRIAQTLALQTAKGALGRAAGPAAGALRYSLTVLFYEVTALARYDSFLTDSRIEEAKTQTFLNKRRLVGELDFEHTTEVYRIYLERTQKDVLKDDGYLSAAKNPYL